MVIPHTTLGTQDDLDGGVVRPLSPHIPAHCHGKSCGLDGESTVYAGAGVHGDLAYVVGEVHAGLLMKL